MKRSRQLAIGIEDYACLTALGNSKETYEKLVENEIALKPTPVLGKDGGDEVPLASIDGYDETIPPRWEKHLDQLLSTLPNRPWGSQNYPVYLSSSNFDVGSLYAYRNSKNESFLKMGTPARTLECLRKRYGWGTNTIAISHACVTAHVAIEMASRSLNSGLSKQALILSFDFISPFVSGGFHSLKILNSQMPAPFQDREIGSIGLGDGAAYLILLKADTPYRIDGNFLHNEMYHFTSNEPNGSGFMSAANWTLDTLGDRKAWIKGHCTGTLESGRMEAEAFDQILPHSPLVSWKGSLGHTLGSCGAVEMAIVLEAIKGGKSPGTPGCKHPTFTSNVSIEPFDTQEFDAVALFSNAFGGAHGGCVIRYD